MSKYKIKIPYNDDNDYTIEELDVFCSRLSNRNISTLYMLEKYLNKSLLSEKELIEIRKIILDVSGYISRIPNQIVYGDEDERL